MNTHRIEILNPVTGLPLQGNDVKELKDVFLTGNVVRYYIINNDHNNDHPLTFDTRNRIETGTPQLNFIFDIADRSIEEEVTFMKKRIRELQVFSKNWFDKRTKEYKHAISHANGFNTPLLFEEIK